MDRTVTVSTMDHGYVTISEPAWCVGHDDDPAGPRADILHSGPERSVTFRGRDLGDACLVLSPFADDPRPAVSVGLTGFTLDAIGLYELAAALDTHADQLRDLADQLRDLAGQGDAL